MFICKICNIEFNLVTAIPYILRCGHTFCGNCISGSLSAQDFFECSNCVHRISDDSELIPNYILCDKTSMASSMRASRRIDPPGFFNKNTTSILKPQPQPQTPFFIPDRAFEPKTNSKMQIEPLNIDPPYRSQYEQNSRRECNQDVPFFNQSNIEFESVKTSVNSMRSNAELGRETAENSLTNPRATPGIRGGLSLSRSGYITPIKGKELPTPSKNMIPNPNNVSTQKPISPSSKTALPGKKKCINFNCNNFCLVKDDVVYDYCGYKCQTDSIKNKSTLTKL